MSTPNQLRDLAAGLADALRYFKTKAQEARDAGVDRVDIPLAELWGDKQAKAFEAWLEAWPANSPMTYHLHDPSSVASVGFGLFRRLQLFLKMGLQAKEAGRESLELHTAELWEAGDAMAIDAWEDCVALINGAQRLPFEESLNG